MSLVRLVRMENKIKNQEEDMRRSRHKQIKNNKLKQLEGQPVGSLESEGTIIADRLVKRLSKHFPPQPVDGNMTCGFQEDGSSEVTDSQRLQSTSNDSIWSTRLREQLGKDAQATGGARMETGPKSSRRKDDEEKTKKRGMKSLRRWFGDETATDTDNTDSDEGEWGQIDRQKKRNIERKKKLKERQTLDKARHILGIGPIKDSEIRGGFEKDYNKVKIKAVKELLATELRFNKDELEEMKIDETMTSSKGDRIMYCAFKDQYTIREIHMRLAESRNQKVKTREFIPLQLFEHFMELNRICTENWQLDPNIKTQIRFGEEDLEILTKIRGEVAPYHMSSQMFPSCPSLIT